MSQVNPAQQLAQCSPLLRRAALELAPVVSARRALYEVEIEADKSDALPRARALVAAAEAVTAGDAASLVLADALLTLVQTRTLPPFQQLDKDFLKRANLWEEDEPNTLAVSRRCVDILHARLQAGTLFETDARETMWLSENGGLVQRPHELLALAALDVLAYWPDEHKVAAAGFLRAAVRTLVQGFLFQYELLGLPSHDGASRCLMQALQAETASIVPFFLYRARAIDGPPARRGGAQPLTLEVLQERLLAEVLGIAGGELLNMQLFGKMPSHLQAVAFDSHLHAELVAKQAERAQCCAPELEVDDAEHKDVMAQVADCMRKSIAAGMMLRMDITRARREADRLQALLAASALPADSLVRARAHLVFIAAYESPAAAPRNIGMDDLAPARREAWRGEHAAALLAASRAAADILLRRAEAETLLTVARHEWTLMHDAKIDHSSVYSILSSLGSTVAESWPRDGDAAPQFDAIMSLAVRTCIEGRINGLAVYLPHEDVRVRMTLSTGAGMSGLINRLLTPKLLPRARAWADERALRALLRDTVKAVDAVPRFRNLRGDAESQLERYRARLDQRGGLRPCGHADCAATEAHAGQFKRCMACKKAVYCSRVCQQTAWKQHKAECRAAQALQAAGAAASA